MQSRRPKSTEHRYYLSLADRRFKKLADRASNAREQGVRGLRSEAYISTPQRREPKHNAAVGRLTHRSLVAVAVGFTAVRTHPGNAVARKPPEILIHTRLAHGETALAAGPAEWDLPPGSNGSRSGPGDAGDDGRAGGSVMSFRYLRVGAGRRDACRHACCLREKMICPLPHQPNAGV
jgi:hypothetical protein